MFKQILLSLLYVTVAFLLLTPFADWPESYILWYTWRGIQFNILNEILFYLGFFCAYIWLRCIIKTYKLIIFIDFFYSLFLFYNIFYFFEGFQYLNINLLNVSITGVLYLYLIMFFYFFIDFLYCFYQIWLQTKNGIKNWSWKIKLNKKSK